MKSFKLPFSQVVKRRISLLWAVLALLLAFMVLVGEKGLIDSRYTTGLSQLSYKALYFGGVIYTIYKIHYNRSLIKKQGKAASGKNSALDERTQWIHTKKRRADYGYFSALPGRRLRLILCRYQRV